MAYVYLIKCNDFVKIGVADKPNVRLSALQSGCPYELILIGVSWDLSRPLAEKMEGALHFVFYEDWIRGEWYNGNAVEEWLYSDLETREQITKECAECWNELHDANKVIHPAHMEDYLRKRYGRISAMQYKSSLKANKWRHI